MKKVILFIHFLFSMVFGYSQIENIELPKGGIDTFDFKKNHYTIHITGNNEIYFNRKRIRFWDQIPSLILEEKRVPKFNAANNIVLYVDKGASIIDVQRIRDEFGKVWQGFIHYMSDDISSNKCLSFFISSSFLLNNSITNGNYLYEQEVIYTNEEKLHQKKVPKLEERIFPTLSAVWEPNFLNIFFTGKVDYIKQLLKEVKYATIDTYYCMVEYLPYETPEEQTKQLDKLIKGIDVLFVSSSPSNSFNTYYKAMIEIQKRRVLDPKSSEVRKPLIIDVSNTYSQYLKEKGLDLFNQKSSNE